MKLPNGQLSTTQLSIGIHVDDLIITYDDQINNLHLQFGEVINVTESKTSLRLYIEYSNDNSIKLSQPGYIPKIIQETNLHNVQCTIPSAPLPVNYKRNTDSTPLATTQQEEYRETLGLLNHCEIDTRPDILYSVSVLASYITTSKHIKMMILYVIYV